MGLLDSIRRVFGRAESAMNEADLSAAIRHFDRAVQLDTNFAPAYVGLAHAWQERGVWGNFAFPDVRDKVRAAVLRALALDPDSASAHAHPRFGCRR